MVLATKELLEGAGHTVAVFGMNDPRNLFTNEYFIDNIDYRHDRGAKKIRNAFKFIYNFDAREKFLRLARDFRPDVIHFHNIYHQLSYSLLPAAKELNIPMVMTLHDYKMISPNYNLFHHGKIDESAISGNYWKCLTKNCLENFWRSALAAAEAYFRKWKKWELLVDAYIAPSDFLKKKFLQAGWEENKLRTIIYPCAVPGVENSPRADQTVVFFGRLAPEKGIEVLLGAARRTPELNYQIIGTGPLADQIKNIIAINNLANVHLLGHLNGAELWRRVATAGLVVVPSLWYETGGPLTVAEALLSGTPVIASAIGSIPEILPPAMLVPPNDAESLARKIKEWFAQPDLEKNNIISDLQKKTKEKYDPQLYLKKLEDLYGRVVIKEV